EAAGGPLNAARKSIRVRHVDVRREENPNWSGVGSGAAPLLDQYRDRRFTRSRRADRLILDTAIAALLFDVRCHRHGNTQGTQRPGKPHHQRFGPSNACVVMLCSVKARSEITDEQDGRRAIASHTFRSRRWKAPPEASSASQVPSSTSRPRSSTM